MRGWGLDPTAMLGASLSRTFLDAIVGERPAYVGLFDAHAALVSTVGLQAAGVDGPVAFDQADEVMCDEDGTPTGLLQEAAAVELVRRLVPVTTPTQRRARLADTFAADPLAVTAEELAEGAGARHGGRRDSGPRRPARVTAASDCRE